MNKPMYTGRLTERWKSGWYRLDNKIGQNRNR